MKEDPLGLRESAPLQLIVQNQPSKIPSALTIKSWPALVSLLGVGLALCFLNTGCAFSRTETKVNFSPAVNAALPPNPKASLQLGEFKDTRSVKDANVVMHKQNAYGTTTGAYVAKQPVAEIFRAGLAEALQRNGFQASSTVQYELWGELQDYEFEVIAGFWKGTVKPKLAVRFELVEKAANRAVWHDTIIGRDTVEASWATSELAGQMFTKAADDVAKKLITDGTFRAFFE